MSLGKLLAWAKDLLGQLKTMKYCKNCKHYFDRYCFSPNNEQNMVSGSRAKYAYSQREDDQQCGKDAAWFEDRPLIEPTYIYPEPITPEPKRKKWWARLLG